MSQIALFRGFNASGITGLWVTDGTANGTYELTGIAGVSSSGLAPSGFTVFNGQVLFAGSDASGASGLWITDGTAAGTTKLASTGYQFGLAPSSFTILGNKALFMGFDANGAKRVWVTDGTPGGTSELVSNVTVSNPLGSNPGLFV